MENKEEIISNQVIKRKRGRPRKNQIVQTVEKLKDKTMYEKKDKNNIEEEIILHLPINFSDINKFRNLNNEKTEDQNVFEKSDNANDANIFTMTDMSYENSSESQFFDDTKELIKKIKEQEKIIKKLEDELKNYKMFITDNINNGIIDNKVTKMDVNFISTVNNQQIIVDKTDIACWWCTYNFDTLPCFIPERFSDETYYVFGCFCSYNCAAAYSLSMNDYNVWNRYSLIKKLYNQIYKTNEDIPIAPPRESLKKFGGPLTIDEFKKNSKKCEKEYRFILPPMVSLVPLIEETYKNFNKFNKIKEDSDSLVLKRTKPLPNSRNTLVDTFKIFRKKY